MPYMPRQYASTIGATPEVQRKDKPEENKKTSTEDTDKEERASLGMQKINPHTYEPDFDKVYQTLFGRAPVADPNTGQLVYTGGGRPSGGMAVSLSFGR